MASPLHNETAVLSLIGKPNHAIALDKPQHKNESVKDIAALLPAILQTTLTLDDVIHLFHQEISKVLPYSSLHYQHQAVNCDITIGSHSHHSCNYRLEINQMWLGELTLTRRNKFSDADTKNLENLLCKLIYPLRNCLLYRQAQTASLQDKLTGLNNRASFDSNLKREINIAQRQHTPMSLLVIDIDHFKEVNDTYGHSGGDKALQLLAKSITDTMRNSDIAFRYGGEEFTLILSNTDTKNAYLAAERIRLAASQLSCTSENKGFSFTISLGLAQLAKGEDGASLFDRADKALYKAKESGRNKTTCA
jgi:diguanylate cyclase (GGDEF)-like protein